MPAISTPLRLNASSTRCGPLTEHDFVANYGPTDPQDVASRTLEALRNPLGYPLGEAITSDDRIAIALARGVSDAVGVVLGLVTFLTEHGAPGDRIRVVLPGPTTAAQLGEGLAEALPTGVVVETHDPTDAERNCFVGTTQGDRSLMLDRTLFDADLLIPILAERPGEVAHATPYDGLFPDFCDQPTIERVSRVRSIAGARTRGGDHASHRRGEFREVGWMIGVPFLVRVVPGSDANGPTIVAGEVELATEKSRKVGQQAWSAPTPELADLVILKLHAEPAQQTWQMVAQALELADQLIAPNGAVVLWTDLDQPIGESLGRLVERDESGHVAHALIEDSGEEAWAAWQMLLALERGPLFFSSRLDEERVEDLGLTPVANVKEVLRLVGRRGSCILVEGAEHISLNLTESSEGP